MANTIPISLNFRCGIGRGKRIVLTLKDGAGSPLNVTRAVLGIASLPTAIQKDSATGSGSGVTVDGTAGTVTIKLLPADTAGAQASNAQIDVGIEIASDPTNRRDAAVGLVTFEKRIGSFS